MSIFRLDRMTWEEVDGLDRPTTVFFLPVSPIEEHGPHLPLGTDFYGAHDMAELALQKLEAQAPAWNYVLVPGLPLGCTEMTMEFAGTLSVRGQTLVRVLEDVCGSIARHGFKYIVLANHHLDLGHVKALHEAIRRVTKRYKIQVVEPAAAVLYASEPPALEKTPAQTEVHADVRETSFIAYRYPDLLKGNYLTLPPVRVDIAQCFRKGIRTLKRMGAALGYIGSPALATVAQGKQHLEGGAEILASATLKLMRGETLPQIPKEMQFVLKHFVRLD